MTASAPRPAGAARVVLVTTYFPFFDGVFPDSYRESQERNADDLAGQLTSAGLDVVHVGLSDSRARAEELVPAVAAAAPDVVVIAPMMAAPATHFLPVVERVDRPVVVLQVLRRRSAPPDYDEIAATEDSTFLGATMACAGLRRLGRPFVHETLAPDESPDRLRRVVTGAAAVTRLVGRRVGVVGEPVEGYVDVEITEPQLAAAGITRVGVRPGDILDAFGDASPEPVLAALRDGGASVEAAPEEIERDLRLGAALSRVADERGIDGLALNCHDRTFRYGEVIGVPACLAGSVLATRGIPTTCTGDVSTAIALLVGQQVGAKVLYCEPFTFGADDHKVVLGSCGIGPLGMSARPRPRVCRGFAYPGSAGPGGRVIFGLAPGPATMIAHIPAHDPRSADPGELIWMAGDLTGEHFPNMHGANTVFVPRCADPRAALNTWASLGPAHHVALVEGAVDVELETLGRFSRFRVTRVGAPPAGADRPEERR